MARRKKSRDARQREAHLSLESSSRRRLRRWWGLFGLLILAAAALAFGRLQPKNLGPALRVAPALSPLEALAALPQEELEKVDIALMNLRCAEGLRGSEGLDIPSALQAFDRYADRVETETVRNFHKYRDNPADFENSEAYFRLLMMAVVMQEDFSVRYNPALISTPGKIDPNDGFSDDAKNVFLNGLTGPPMMGTCSSMPVLYVAVGRRLGYPMYLVSTKAHLFARWDDGRTRLNMEATGRGFSSYQDDEYTKFPLPVSDEEIAANHYLASMTPKEELACFLSGRAGCVLKMGRYAHANWCIHHASQLAPDVRDYRLGIPVVERKLMNFRLRQQNQFAWMSDNSDEPASQRLSRPVETKKAGR